MPGGRLYEGTSGLWYLIVHKDHDDNIYALGGIKKYSEILVNNKALNRNKDPDS
jgi:hypothetical protein